jgi:hypothetical protein
MRSTSTALPTVAPAAAPVPVAIRVLRRLNPAIGILLRSPLHGLLSRNLLMLTYVGRKTGRRRSLPLSYVTVGERAYLCTRSSRWWRNWQPGAAVELHLRGRRMNAVPCVVDVATPEALAALRVFLTANPKTGQMLYAVRAERGRPNEDDLVREVRRSVVIRLDPA